MKSTQRFHHSLILGLFAMFSLPASAQPPVPDPPTIAAESYVLMDFESGQILAQRNPDARIEPASITKIMTAYIVASEIEKGNLRPDDEVTISEQAWRMGGSKMFIEVGKKIPVSALVKGMVISSGNDATVALAEHIAGSEETFAAYMNQYAENMGLKNTHFTNATGWPDPEHYTTANDIARMTRRLIRDFPEHYDLYDEKYYTYNDIKQPNRNSLLWRDESVDGVKTGHTESAGYCLVASAKREDMRLISVVIGTDSNNARTSANQSLLNYGFRFFETRQLFARNKPIKTLPVWKGGQDEVAVGHGRALHVTIPRGRMDALKLSAKLPEDITAPVRRGQRLGSLQVQLEDQIIRNASLYALEDVPLGSWWSRMVDEVLLLIQR